MLIINSKKELIDYLRTDRESDNKITLIPTMGNLHKGHLSLIDKSEEFLSKRVVSIFVNPLQFDDLDDYTSYPKTIEKDLEALEKKEIDYVFVPRKKEMIENIIESDILPWGFSNLLCGAFRGKHFQGVQNIIRELFEIIKPNFAIFGEKDFQQYLLIKYINEQYFQKDDIQIILSPTIRMKSGLAFSSRNIRLSDDQITNAALAFQSIKNTVLDYFRATGLFNFENLIPQLGRVTYQYVKIYNEKYLYDKHGLKIDDNCKQKNFRLFIALEIDNVRLIDNYLVEGYDII
tara:strand:- start:92 stop:961 length:870 start_codon:yes stop_codon:yes gene_type:complete